VRDRVLHRAIYKKLYPFFDRTFVPFSFSCRNGKGTHKALKCFRSFISKVGKNNTKTCWVLKCDIKKFFASIDHKILLGILARYIQDKNTLWLLEEIIRSFDNKSGVGLPLGNLTSQLFANVYLNEFDQFVKHKLKAKYYARYADDFVLLSENRLWLEGQIPLIKNFLWGKLKLILHPQKISIKTASSGVDFLGWVNFSDHKVLRTTTKKRMIKKIGLNPSPETVASYSGLLGHGNAWKLKIKILG
jgi:retron-type reverse transcriptase